MSKIRNVRVSIDCLQFCPLRILLLSLFLFFVLTLNAQSPADNWYFGAGAGVSFTSGGPVVLTDGMISSAEGVSSLSDASGNLLFYTDGLTVFNRNHLSMPNGSGLLGGNSSSQSAVAMPKPGSSNLFYLFTADQDAEVDGIRYSLINMSLNSGLGDVVVGQKNIPLLAPATEKLSAVKHCNNRDSWIVAHDWESNQFYSWLLSPTGVSAIPVISAVGAVHDQSVIGCMKIAPNGSKLALSVYDQGGQHFLQIFDFNSSTGQLSNPITKNIGGSAYGVEFSPNSQYVYYTSSSSQATATIGINQIDLCAGSNANILASETNVGSTSDGFIRTLQLGPDAKLYFARFGQPWLGVIPDPNLGAPGCGFQINGVSLGAGICRAGLPNFNQSFFEEDIQFSSASTCLDASFSAQTIFDNATCLSPINGILWDFGEPSSGANNSSTLVTPSHTYSAVGNYTVRLIVNYPCGADTVFASVNIQCGLQISIPNQSICQGQCTNLQATVTGGVPPYTWTWTGVTASTSGPVNVCPTSTTTYSAIVTDYNGLTASASTTVTVNSLPNASVVTIPVTCFGLSNGGASVTIAGGPYTYSWNSSPVQLGNTLSNVPGGVYNVTITNSQNCSKIVSANVIQPASLYSNIHTTNSSCGQSNGSSTLIPIGGTAPYSFVWNTTPVQTTATASGLAEGDYHVDLTDANGCTTSADAQINNHVSHSAYIDFLQGVTCQGGSDGSLIAILTSGTPPYTYLWSNGQTSQIAIGLAAGTHSVQVSDAANCPITYYYTLDDAVGVGIQVNVSDAICGQSNGAASLILSGGFGPFTIDWASNPGQNVLSISNVHAGPNSVSVLDQTGCTYTADFTVNSSPSPQLQIDANQLISCVGGNNGSLTATVTSGTAPYTYFWSNGATTPTISNLGAANYNCALTDATGCTANVSYQLVNPSAISISPSVTQASCGQNNGAISITISGGTAPYQIAWASGEVTNTISNLAAGSYSVTVSDANSCIQQANFTVSAAGGPIVNLVSNSSVSCFGLADGSASISISGGSLPYSSVWNDGNTSLSRSNLLAGLYTVNVTDALGCATALNITITEPSAINASWNIQAESCGSGNGSAEVIAIGGTAPYTYIWTSGETTSSILSQPAGNIGLSISDAVGCSANFNNSIPAILATPASISISSSVTCHDSSDATIQVISNQPVQVAWADGGTSSARSHIPGGNYTAYIVDGAGCLDTLTVNVYNPPAISANIVVNDATCSAADGSAQISYLGGTGSLSHIWMNGSTSGIASNLAFGNISAVVTDANGCELSVSSQIGTVSPLQIDTINVVAPSCPGGNDGSAIVQISSNSGPISYSWSNGANGAVVNGLSTGNYSVTVSEASGCSALRTFQVQDPVSINSQIVTSDVLCFGGSNGQATISVTGGSDPYTVTWPNGQTSSSLSNLSAGAYAIVIEDNLGCQVIQNLVINQPDSISANITTSPATCGAASGSATVLVQGGTLPYFYMWSNLSNTSQANSLIAGTANVLVSDANGCQRNFSAQIQSAPAASVQLLVNNTVSCFGGNDAELEITSSSPVSVVWNDGNTQSIRSSLAAGSYTAITTDAGGCLDTLSIQVNQPSALSYSLSVTSATCTSTNGNASIVVNGGLAPYAYLWSNGATNSSLSNVATGFASVQITDAKSCVLFADTVIPSQNPLVIDQINTTDVSCFGLSDGNASALVSGSTGAVSYAWSSGSTGLNVSGLIAGNYFLTIADSAGCIRTSTFLIDSPADLQATTLSESTSCYGFSDGQSSVFVNGGLMPYSYSWDGIIGAAVNNNLAAGDHSLVITDFNNCSIQQVVSVEQPNEIVVMIDVQVATCGLANGNMEANVTGGTMPYQYAWSSGESTSGLSNLLPGTYAISVTDANGCIGNLTKSFTDVGPPTIQVLNSVNVSCFNGSNGSIELVVNGGSGTLITNWNSGEIGEVLNGLTAGLYSATVTDDLGCSSSISHTITQPLKLESNLQANDVQCFGGSSGSIVTHITGGTPTYTSTIVVLGSTVLESALNLNANVYAVTISDANGCQLNDTLGISQPEPLSISFATSDVLCFGGADGSASATVEGGTFPYQYLWSSGETTNAVDSLNSGNYNLTITDSLQCIANEIVFIDQPNLLQLTISGPPEICADEQVNFHVFGSGGFGDYSVQWMSGENTDAISFISDTSIAVSVVVTDENQCIAAHSRNLIVNQLPVIELTPMSSTSCAGECVQVQTSSVEGGVYTWTTSLNSKASGRLVSFCFEEEGQIDLTLQVTDIHGCSSSAWFDNYFTVYPLPRANFSVSETNVPLLDALIHFTNTSQDAVSSLWNFDDRIEGEESWESSTSYQFTEIGSYPVTLKVVNEFGCVDETVRWVQVTKDFAVYLPSAFTPNADGLNDGFKPQGIGYEVTNYSFSIFDRWGNSVFFTDNPNQAWDGTYQLKDSNASKLSNDVFIWKLQLEDFSGLLHDYSGSVTLVR